MRIGVYGGTFNPPHLGHLAAARTVMGILNLDELYLVPVGLPPHKELPPGSPTPRQRLEMVRLAGWELGIGDRVKALDIELARSGKSYTADTLAAIHQRNPEAELWLLVGTDMFLTLQYWHNPWEIFNLAGIAAFGRTEADTEEVFSTQRQYLHRTFPQANIFTITVPEVIDISSTELRGRLERGEGGRLLPPAVYGYILRQGLYNTRADMKHLSLSDLRSVSLSFLHWRRVSHVLGTEQEAIRLAVRYGADVEKARRAALLHDCTKRLGREAQLQLCLTYGIEPDEVELANSKLLHAKTGAALAEEMFGVDGEIRDAIRYHTTGRADMTLLDKILYLADYIEPSRDFPGVAELRRRCYEDLDGGLEMALSMSIREMEKNGAAIHRATLDAWEALKERK